MRMLINDGKEYLKVDEDKLFIETHLGKRFHFLKPRDGEISILDIAHALSHICRFNGHCNYFYSVAQHSINVRNILAWRGYSEGIQLVGLLHDASEAYLADIPRPIKPYIKSYSEIEAKIQQAIWKEYSLLNLIDEDCLTVIKQADNDALYYEGLNLMDNIDGWAFSNIQKINEDVVSFDEYEFEDIKYLMTRCAMSLHAYLYGIHDEKLPINAFDLLKINKK